MKRIALLVVAVGVMALPLRAQPVRFLVYEDFDTPLASATLPDGWAILDENSDGVTWSVVDWGGTRGGPAVRYLSNGAAEVADDWLVTPAVELHPDTPYGLRFHTRVTSPDQPHDLHVYTGEIPGTGTLLLELPGLSGTLPEEHQVDFDVPSSGDYHLQFRCVSGPANHALYLDRVVLEVPETRLEIGFQLDADHSGAGNPVFGPEDPIEGLVFVRNVGNETIVLNQRMTIRDANDPDGVLSFEIIDPGGSTVPFEARIREALPTEEDIVEVEPDGIIYKYFDLNIGIYDLSAEGEYTARATYLNTHAPEGLPTPWRGRLVSDAINFTIVTPAD